MSKVAILGWYGEKNVGDETFRQVFQQQLSGHELACVQKLGHAPFKPDHVIFGGGGVVCDWYFKGLTKEQPLYAMGVDLDTDGPRYDQWTSYNFQKLYCRSQLYTRDLRNRHKPVEYLPDIAFALNYQLAPIPERPKKRRIAITLTNELLRYPKALDAVHGLIDRFDEGWEVSFVTFYDGAKDADRDVHAAVLAKISPSAQIFQYNDYQDPAAILSLLSGMDLVLTMRFHGVIFSTMVGVPFISLSTVGKNSLYCEQESIADRIAHLEHITANDLETAVYSTLLYGPYVSKQLSMIAARNKRHVLDAFETVRNTWLTP